MWRTIQQQLDLMNFGIDIGQFNKNNTTVIFSKFKNMNYHSDLDINIKKCINYNKKQLRNFFDYYFNKKNF